LIATEAAGVPEIAGGKFGGGGWRPLVLMLNGPIERLSLPSVTLIVMSAESPTSPSSGMPLRVPVSGLKSAHAG
jgi:hypothetical protein